MRAYLDFNIFAAIEKGDYSLSKVLKIDNQITDFPYSAAHIQETSNIIGADRILSRIKTIRSVSKNSYLYQEINTNEIVTLDIDPNEVWETIHQVPLGISAIGVFTNLFTHDVRNQIITDLGINIKEINNYSPTEVVNHLNKKIELYHTFTSLTDLIEQAISFFPSTSNFGLHHKMAAMIEIIDMLGYWRDKPTDKSNTARFWDGNHSYYATACDYFISDDKRNRYKTKVIYEIYNIKTKVISPDGIS